MTISVFNCGWGGGGLGGVGGGEEREEAREKGGVELGGGLWREAMEEAESEGKGN